MGEGQSTDAWVSKKSASPSHSSHHLPIAPQLGIGFHKPLHMLGF